MISYTLIVNSRSNSSRSEQVIRSSEKLIKDTLQNCTIVYVDDPSKLIAESSKAASATNVVIACGGDGTVQSVARGISGSNTTMGIVPLGSGNDFAKSVGLRTKQSLKYYLDIIVNDDKIEVDLPTLNRDIFLNTCGVGFDGLTSFYASEMKLLKGSIKYTYAGFKAFLTAKPFEIALNLDGKESVENVWLFAIANGAIEGGKYIISPNSINTDGLLELVTVPAYSKIKLVVAFILLSLRRPLPDGFSDVKSFKNASIKTKEKQHIHLDGEIGIPTIEYSINLKSNKLRVIGNR